MAPGTLMRDNKTRHYDAETQYPKEFKEGAGEVLTEDEREELKRLRKKTKSCGKYYTLDQLHTANCGVPPIYFETSQ